MANETNLESLASLLGFDPTKKNQPTNDVLSEVIKELDAERRVKAKDEAKKVLTEALDLANKMKEAEKQFNTQKEKFNKELGKLLSTLGRWNQGGETKEETPSDAETPKEQ